jgi:hypothetical protein
VTARRRLSATLDQGGTPAAPNRLAIAMNGVASGRAGWLDIVPLIRPGTDGETGEGLTMSLSDALSKNAAGVLRLISSARMPSRFAAKAPPRRFDRIATRRSRRSKPFRTRLSRRAKTSCLTHCARPRALKNANRSRAAFDDIRSRRG